MMAPERGLYPNPGTCKQITLLGKRGFAEMIKLKILQWEISLDYPDRLSVIPRVLMRGRGRQESQKKMSWQK